MDYRHKENVAYVTPEHVDLFDVYEWDMMVAMMARQSRKMKNADRKKPSGKGT